MSKHKKVIKKEELYSLICKSQDNKPSQSKIGVNCTHSEISHKAIGKYKEGRKSERNEAAQ